MRAATVIIAAVAASSILIALAFILSGGGGSSQTTTTRTVIEEVTAAIPKKAQQTSGQESSAPQVGGLTQCEEGAITVEEVPCEVGVQIHAEYEEGGRDGLLGQVGDETITMTCDEGTVPITCTGPGGAAVYFGK